MNMRFRSKHRVAELESGLFAANPAEWRGRWGERFGNGNEVHAEIGAGRGEFVIQSALARPDINFIALEKLDRIIPSAVKDAETHGLVNLAFVHANARLLTEIFGENELRCIYINFCDPWRNKAGWMKRRLTHRGFLDKYKEALEPEGRIEFKTDDRFLFEFSLREFTETGFGLENVTCDLHKGNTEGNIMTNYERRFAAMGKPIYRAVAVK
jgi:tRNA (guanine-N7-)-methyltransferase